MYVYVGIVVHIDWIPLAYPYIALYFLHIVFVDNDQVAFIRLIISSLVCCDYERLSYISQI